MVSNSMTGTLIEIDLMKAISIMVNYLSIDYSIALFCLIHLLSVTNKY